MRPVIWEFGDLVPYPPYLAYLAYLSRWCSRRSIRESSSTAQK